MQIRSYSCRCFLAKKSFGWSTIIFPLPLLKCEKMTEKNAKLFQLYIFRVKLTKTGFTAVKQVDLQKKFAVGTSVFLEIRHDCSLYDQEYWMVLIFI
jgi:hypothetical protein